MSTLDVCECGHLDVPTHGDDGELACRMDGCACEAFKQQEDEEEL